MSDLGGEPWTIVQKRGNRFVVNAKPFLCERVQHLLVDGIFRESIHKGEGQ